MIKNKKTDILLNKFKLKYRVIFSNKNLKIICNNHFDKKMGFGAFVLGLLQNQLGEKKALKHVQINDLEWIKLISDIYDSEEIKNTYSELCLNPIIQFENIEKHFDCFNISINKIVNFMNSEQLDLHIPESNLKFILKSAFGFIMYNCIDCKIPYELKDILMDQDYDQKFTMITNNTKLFAKAKKAILSNCGTKINDILSLLLGISNNLNFDK